MFHVAGALRRELSEPVFVRRAELLHQAETKGGSTVKKRSDPFVVQDSASGGGIVINAQRFREELEGAFEDYVAQILGGDATLRAAFIKKMNHIATITLNVVDVV